MLVFILEVRRNVKASVPINGPLRPESDALDRDLPHS